MAYAYIARIEKIAPIDGADRIVKGRCLGDQVIVSKDIQEGQLGLFITSDSQVGEEFAKVNNLLRRKDSDGNSVGGFLDPQKRNVRAIRLRGEMSDGLFLPLSSLESFGDTSSLKEGDEIDTFNGVEIAKKYIPRTNRRTPVDGAQKTKKVVFDKFSTPDFQRHVDTGHFQRNLHAFEEGQLISISLKMHGTSGRTGRLMKYENRKPNFLNKFLSKLGLIKMSRPVGFETVSGTRRVVLDSFEGGFYGNDNFRKKYHDLFSSKLLDNETVYYEIVGYIDEDTPIMSKCSVNKLLLGKDFIKEYGKEDVVFDYGLENGQNDIYVYRITRTLVDGSVIEYTSEQIERRCQEWGIKTAPILTTFVFDGDIQALVDRVESLTEGEDLIGNHIREGVIVRIEDSKKFKVFKSKSFTFKVLEGIIKDAGIVECEDLEAVS